MATVSSTTTIPPMCRLRQMRRRPMRTPRWSTPPTRTSPTKTATSSPTCATPSTTSWASTDSSPARDAPPLRRTHRRRGFIFLGLGVAGRSRYRTASQHVGENIHNDSGGGRNQHDVIVHHDPSATRPGRQLYEQILRKIPLGDTRRQRAATRDLLGDSRRQRLRAPGRGDERFPVLVDIADDDRSLRHSDEGHG